MSKSKSQIIFVDSSEGVAEVVHKLNLAKSAEVTLSVPHRALILQNPINLSIIKRAADDLDCSLLIATTDLVGKKFAQQAGLALTEGPDESSAAASSLIAEDINPLESSSDDSTTPEDRPSFPSRASNFGKIINPQTGFRLKSLFKTDSTAPLSEEDIEIEDDEPILSRPSFRLPSLKRPHIKLPQWHIQPHHRVAMALAGVGLIMLGTVSFFVLPKAYVSLEVQSEPFRKQFTLVLADEQDLQAAGPNIISGRFIQTTRENSSSFSATGEENKGNKATGQINAVNLTNGIQGILANTRFVSSTGLGFIIKNDVLVPPAHGNTPGKTVVEATADTGGTKYNVTAPLKLDIPNISSGLKPLLYGEIVGTFAGGTDNVVKVVSQADIDKGKEEAAKNIFTAAETELGKQIKRGEDFNPAFIQNDVIDAVPSVTPGAEQDQFDIRVQSRSWTILSMKNEFSTALVNAATFEVDADKQVTNQTLKSAKVEPVESNFIDHRVNLLISLDGHVGPRVDTTALVKNITNKSRADAEKYLSSIANISSSSLDLWPTFLRRVPLLDNNVRVQIIYLGE